MSDNDRLDEAFAIKGVTYLVYITRPANAASIQAAFQTAENTSNTSPAFGALLVEDPSSLNAAYATLLAANDASVDCVLIARQQPAEASRHRIDTYKLDQVDDPEEDLLAWTRDV